MCGVIQPSGINARGVVCQGEQIHVSIRTEKPVDADYLAKLISAGGGARIGAGAARLEVGQYGNNVSLQERSRDSKIRALPVFSLRCFMRQVESRYVYAGVPR